MLGFMLPLDAAACAHVPPHAAPVIMTSGNLSDEPQAIGDAEAARKLGTITPLRPRSRPPKSPIAVRRFRHARHGRGACVCYAARARRAPASISLPKGFEDSPDILAYGPEMKATFCLVKGKAGRCFPNIRAISRARPRPGTTTGRNSRSSGISSRTIRRRWPATCAPGIPFREARAKTCQ